jgi:hypothetical protein
MWQRHRRERRVPFALFGGGLVMIAGALIFYVMWLEVSDWPRVEGVITTSAASEGENGWAADVRYRYQVDGKSLESDRTEWIGAQKGLKKGEATDVVARYPVGKQVIVSYNPADPADAVLDVPTSAWFIQLFGVIGLVLLVIGIIKSRALLRRQRKEREAL